MADHIRIEFERVGQTVEALKTASTQIRAELDQLDARLAVMERGWQGDAREAYSVARARWETQMREMQATLDAYSEVLLATGSAIADAESALATSF